MARDILNLMDDAFFASERPAGSVMKLSISDLNALGWVKKDGMTFYGLPLVVEDGTFDPVVTAH